LLWKWLHDSNQANNMCLDPAHKRLPVVSELQE